MRPVPAAGLLVPASTVGPRSAPGGHCRSELCCAHTLDRPLPRPLPPPPVSSPTPIRLCGEEVYSDGRRSAGARLRSLHRACSFCVGRTPRRGRPCGVSRRARRVSPPADGQLGQSRNHTQPAPQPERTGWARAHWPGPARPLPLCPCPGGPAVRESSPQGRVLGRCGAQPSPQPQPPHRITPHRYATQCHTGCCCTCNMACPTLAVGTSASGSPRAAAVATIDVPLPPRASLWLSILPISLNANAAHERNRGRRRARRLCHGPPCVVLPRRRCCCCCSCPCSCPCPCSCFPAVDPPLASSLVSRSPLLLSHGRQTGRRLGVPLVPNATQEWDTRGRVWPDFLVWQGAQRGQCRVA